MSSVGSDRNASVFQTEYVAMAREPRWQGKKGGCLQREEGGKNAFEDEPDTGSYRWECKEKKWKTVTVLVALAISPAPLALLKGPPSLRMDGVIPI